MDKVFRLQGIEFEWDERKYAANVRKHGVRFEIGAEVFFDPFVIYEESVIEDERRETVLGISFSTKLLLVVFLEKDVRTRIISVRAATRREHDEYAKKTFGK